MANLQLYWPLRTSSLPPDEDELHVWAVEIDDVPVPSAKLWAPLADDERDRAERFRFDQPRDRFVAARVALRHLLSGYLGVGPAEVGFVYDAHGKPSLDPARHQTDLQFNLAHSGGLAVVAVSTRCDVGADVECLRAVRQPDGIAQRYFHPSEAAEVLAGGDDQLIDRFFRCWTRKEAVIKAIGTGLQFPLDKFRVPVLEDSATWVDLPTGEKTTADRARLEPCAPCTGYVGAVATLDAERACRYFSVALQSCF